MFLLLVFIAVFIVLTVNLLRARRKLPKGPVPLPLLGNILQIGYYSWKCGGVVEGFNEFRKQYGKVFTLWMGPIPTVQIADFDVAHETHVKRANIFGHRYSAGGINYIREGRGIVTSNGEFWQQHRRFALTTLRNFGLGRNIMEEKIMLEYRFRFDDFKKSHRNNGGIEVNSTALFDYLTGSIINQLLVSERFEHGDEEFEKLKQSITMSFESSTIFEAFAPLWLLKSDLMKWRTKNTLAPFDYILKVVKETIHKRMEAIECGKHTVSEEGDDFVDAFWIKMEKDKKDGIESSFSLETLAIDMYDLWLGGQETTSNTLNWSFACLSNHPEVVRKLRSELVQVTGGNRSLSLTDRPNTSYLNATINEIQRIASILNQNLLRVLQEDTVVDGQPISAGTVFTTQLSMLHTDDSVFQNPNEFNPERFLENNNLEKTLIPFGIGKRVCLGESLARAELFLIIGNIVLEYNLEPVGPISKSRQTLHLD